LPRWSRTYEYTPKSKFRLTHYHRVSFWFEFQRARAAFMASRSAPADGRPVSDRQLGRVRKSVNEKMWSAGFEFQQRGVRTAFDGPMRDTRAAAEIDRQFVAAAVSRVTRSSREHACKKSLTALRERTSKDILKVPGSVSTSTLRAPRKLRTMNCMELRNLVNCTRGIVRDKMDAKGSWVAKNSGELRAELLALKAAKSDSSKSRRVKKRPAAMKSVPRVRRAFMFVL
jgi:hypothetical protein